MKYSPGRVFDYGHHARGRIIHGLDSLPSDNKNNYLTNAIDPWKAGAVILALAKTCNATL